ncbi:MAG: ABC transporter permease [Xenococcaceae cyanobacterium MO_207.B15]|nr:ABC transporter permease [Xenococcaceae cyanobacterium MO_207.B15]
MNKLTNHPNNSHNLPASNDSWVVYTPDSQLKNPVLLAKLMWRDLLASRELAWRLLVRDINAQYRQSALGFFWAVVPAIITALGFTLAKNTGIINIGDTELPYPVYVMFSTTLWQTFVEAIIAPIQALGKSRAMLARINFPREAIVLSQLGQIGFNLGIKLVFIIALFVWYRVPITPSVILAPVGLIHLVMLGTALGLFLAPIGTLYQDVSRLLTIFTGLWLFLTPVVYPVPTQGLFSSIVKFNPVTPLLVTTRELATTGVISNPQGFWLVSIIAMMALFIGWVLYRQAMPYIIERISA